jgi:hypothetical protein
VQTNRIVSNNKTDFKIRDNKQGKGMPIDGAIPAYRTVIKKEAEKILKCNNHTIEIQRTWNVKAKMIQIITGQT